MKRSDELADASGENADAVGNLGNKTALGSKGTNSVAHQFSSANSSHVYVIWFHLHEYAKAYSILDSLYQKIEPIDEATALHICLLFLDAALASHDPWKFVDLNL
ncbi:CCR4-NOT transcription complex subunit 10 [Camellia lanceoleosa]|uniref:CCR4-NOT transcription complex subunit 10 n=1 Tax=Camellia lanceoleosa TaxID=1840588 RepID=A0ACC0IF38_9ERIC|nr:CCR4-NOT transcription complex subunit 10 [Camellia lanceoleosa]